MAETNGKTVLIVDDEPAITQLLSMLLGSRGYSTKIAVTGMQALACTSLDIDLILLDIMPPDSEGLKVCRQLKSNSQTREIPIIIISANHNKSEQIESLYLGADDYLTKPFEPEELLARMDVILRRRNPTSQGAYTIQQQETVCELRRIIHEEAINVCFQPIYFLKPMRLFGLEMLSRPQTSGLMVNPEIFFKLALKYGVYCEVEMIGWHKALQTVSRVFDGGQKLFLNCDPYLVESEQFRNVKEMFASYGMPSHEVFLEITERSAVTAYDTFFQRLKEYRHDGFNIAVDDLGSGYSSLEAIVEIKPEVVKLDRHIINGLCADPFKRSIIKLIVEFCRENNIICVAEGIETKEALDVLIELGVPAGQGYYLYRPTDISGFPAMQALHV
jgi:EAL domain-containing protein (putative c-di-GMP-specific phosphodiesterase class I)/CheY-like chemotaxis protein